MSASPSRDEHTKVIFELAQRSLQAQEAKLDELRSRSGTLLAAAAVVTSFLGGVAFSDSKVGWLGWAAVAAFIVAVAATIWIGKPAEWRWRPAAKDVRHFYLECEEGVVPIDEMRLGLAEDMQSAESDNKPALDRRYQAYSAAAIALLVEIVLWMLEFAVA